MFFNAIPFQDIDDDDDEHHHNLNKHLLLEMKNFKCLISDSIGSGVSQ